MSEDRIKAVTLTPYPLPSREREVLGLIPIANFCMGKGIMVLYHNLTYAKARKKFVGVSIMSTYKFRA